MFYSKKYHILLSWFFLLIASNHAAFASDFSLREDYLNQQKRHAEYHYKELKKTHEFHPSSFDREFNFSSPGGKVIAVLMLASIFSPIMSEPIKHSNHSNMSFTNQSSLISNDMGQYYSNQTLSHLNGSKEPSFDQNYAGHGTSYTKESFLESIQPVIAEKKTEANKIVANTQPMSAKERRIAYNRLEAEYRAAEPCEPDTKETLEKYKNLLEQQGRWDKFQENLKICYSIMESWQKLMPTIKKQAFSTKPNSKSFIVNQRQYAVADHKSTKHVLLTANLMKCVGLALYNPEIKRGGLAHIDGENLMHLDAYLKGELQNTDGLTDLQQYLLDVANTTPLHKIRATLISGSSAHINYFMAYLKMLGVEEFEIIINPRWGQSDNSYFNNLPKGSIAIDCKNGKLWEVKNEPVVRKAMGVPPTSDKNPQPLGKIELL